MAAFSPSQLAAWTGGAWSRLPGAPLTGFTVDSRHVRPGEVFVALRTERRDGHAYLADAERAGAGAALVRTAQASVGLPQLVVADPLAAFQAIAREHRRSFAGPVVGISGSAGKTSTKELLARLLGGAAGGVLATEGNLNNHLGVPLTLTRLDPAHHTAAVIEAGISAPGEMAVLAAMIQPDVGIITLVAAAHLEALGGLDGVAWEKSRLLAAVRPNGLAIFPAACAEYAAFRELAVRTCRVAKGVGARAGSAAGSPGPESTVAGFTVSHRADETTIGLMDGALPAIFTLRRISDGMAQNAALAMVAARRLGAAAPAIAERLAGWGPAPLRGEWRHDAGRRLYLDCYNANPAAMADALTAFCGAAPAEEPRLFVLGCMEELGAGGPDYHRELGRFLPLRPGDRAIIVGSQATAVREGALAAGHAAERIQIAATAEEIAPELARFAGAVFIKGSRRYALERALGDGVPAEVAHA